MFDSASLVAGRTSTSTLATAPGFLMDPNGFILSSETGSTSYGSLACDVLGVVGTAQTFRYFASEAFIFSGQCLVRVPWTLTTQCATAAARGTIRATLTIGGVDIASADGGQRNLNSANGTQFTELLAISSTSAVLVPAGTAIVISLIPLIQVVAAAAQVYTPTLRHNPQVIDDQLIVEFGGAA